MPDIYASAEFTIAASCAVDTSQGFLEFKARTEQIYRFKSEALGNFFVSIQVLEDHEPLQTRAWALQEDVLSVRMLSFNRQSIQFECSEESRQLDKQKLENTESIYVPHKVPRTLIGLTIRSEIWYALVEEYTKRNLTFKDDRLLAISGLADRFEGDGKQTYLAGLWQAQLPLSLLWKCVKPERQPEVQRAPSWSWASIDGPVDYRLTRNIESHHDTIKIHEASVVPLRADVKFGSVRPGGSMCISGLMKKVNIVMEDDSYVLFDPRTTVRWRADIYVDALLDLKTVESFNVYVLNYYMTKSIFLKESAQQLRSVGLLLLQTSETNYNRIGAYQAPGIFTDWFTDASLETIYLV
jgi:hypothetical protein